MNFAVFEVIRVIGGGYGIGWRWGGAVVIIKNTMGSSIHI